MDFAAAERFLRATTNETVSRRYTGRLDRMRDLLARLDNPERAFRSIHVGGTSGKGSTATMCAAILHASGRKVGLHTKPHLRSVTERACIDMRPVTEERFASLIERQLPVYEAMRDGPHGAPSYFELLVAAAFLLFAEERVDIAVVEVGIGGTLDGTNVLAPLVSIITNVGLDHTDVLGDTVEKIATDKSGIIKDGVPIVTAAEHPDALAVIREVASRRHAPLTLVKDAARIESQPGEPYSQRARIVTAAATYAIELPVLGGFQLTNAATAIVALEQAPAFAVSPEDVAKGLAGVALPGRMEFYPSRPSLLFDVAHNAEKAAALADGIAQHFPGKRLTFVVAVAEGKAASDMLTAWSALPAHFIFTSFDVSHRDALPPHRLALIAQAQGLSARAIDDPVEALSIARRMAGADELVVVTGSTFLVSTLRDWFAHNVVESSRVGA